MMVIGCSSTQWRPCQQRGAVACRMTRPLPPACTQQRPALATQAAAAAVKDSSHPVPQQTTATGLSQQPASIESACEINKGRIGFNPQGYRGLIAASDIAPGDVVLSIPLHNMLQVPRQLTEVHMHTAAAAALDAWQQQHGQLPPQLLAFLLDSGVIWEAKLVGWLLYLKAAAPQGSLWHSYCQSLPAEAQALTFCSYSEQHAEQLQFSIWKDLAHKQRQLLETVQQQCQEAGLQHLLISAVPAYTGGSSSGDNTGSSSTGSSKVPHQLQQQQGQHPDYAWALGMVKSRTFGQRLPLLQQDLEQQGNSLGARLGASSSAAHSAAAGAQTAAAAAGAQATAAAAAGQELEEDDSSVFLLMAPFLDMINHATKNNCMFGIDPSSTSFTVSSSGSTGIPAGEEVTISYGSNKTNLALLACYGFFIPANPNDAQLLAPVFNICLAAAGDLQGLPAPLLQQAAELSTQQQHQHEQEAALQGPGVALLHPELVAARRQCALQAIPTLQGPDGVGQQGSVHQQQQPQEAQQGVQSQAGAGKSQQQQQRYLVQLMLYQLDLIFKRCGTSIEQDQGVPQQLQDSADSATGAAGSSSPSLDGAIQQQVLLARLEHKLLLRECCVLLQAALQLLDRA